MAGATLIFYDGGCSMQANEEAADHRDCLRAISVGQTGLLYGYYYSGSWALLVEPERR